MANINYNDVPKGSRIPAQIPLDVKSWCKDEATLAYLGVDDNLAYTYHDKMEIHCIDEGTLYQWREVEIGEENTGLVPTDFTYPADTIVYDIDYSNKTFNFFLIVTINADNIETYQQTYDLESADDLAGVSLVGTEEVVDNNTTFIIKKLNSIDDTIDITLDGTGIINIDINPDIIPESSNLEDGITTTVSGDGSLADPWKVEVENLQKTINTFPYTLLDDDDKYTIFIDNSASNVVINIPDTLTSNFAASFIQEGTGDVTFIELGSTVVNTVLGNKIKGQYHWVLLEKKLNTTIYYLIGNTKL